MNRQHPGASAPRDKEVLPMPIDRIPIGLIPSHLRPRNAPRVEVAEASHERPAARDGDRHPAASPVPAAPEALADEAPPRPAQPAHSEAQAGPAAPSSTSTAQTARSQRAPSIATEPTPAARRAGRKETGGASVRKDKDQNGKDRTNHDRNDQDRIEQDIRATNDTAPASDQRANPPPALVADGVTRQTADRALMRQGANGLGLYYVCGCALCRNTLSCRCNPSVCVPNGAPQVPEAVRAFVHHMLEAQEEDLSFEEALADCEESLFVAWECWIAGLAAGSGLKASPAARPSRRAGCSG